MHPLCFINVISISSSFKLVRAEVVSDAESGAVLVSDELFDGILLPTEFGAVGDSFCDLLTEVLLGTK